MRQSIWQRLPLIARLLVTASLALVIAASTMLAVSVRQESEEARHDLNVDLAMRLELLSTLLSEPAVIGDYATIQQSLDRYIAHPQVNSVEFRDSAGNQLRSRSEKTAPSSSAPSWFLNIFGFSDISGSAKLIIGGHDYGEVIITLSSQQFGERAWLHLQNHLTVLLLAIFLDFFGIWLILRTSLAPLKNLEESANIAASGDLDILIEPAGSPELRHLIDAFNRMITNIRTAQDNLLESRQESLRQTKRLSEVIWGTNIGTWEWNVQTGETIFNERWAGVVGYALEELQPVSIETWGRLVHPEDSKQSQELLKRCFERQDEYYECEVRMRHKNGEWVWVLDRGRVVEWAPDGKPLRMSGTHQEITERKLLEETLRLERDFNNAILDTAKSIVMVLNRGGEIVRMNQEAQRFTGYSFAEAAHEPFFWTRFLLPEQQQKVRGVFDNLMTGNVVARYENYWVRRDDSQCLFDWSNSLLRNAAGEAEFLVTVGIDISERKSIEEQLNKSLRYNRSLIEASLDPLATISKDGKIMDVNQATEEMTGIVRAKLIGGDFSDYFTDPEKAREGYQNVFMTGRIRDYPLSIRHVDGHATEVLFSASIFRDEQGEVAGVFAAARDITKLKQTVERIEHMAHFDSLTDLPNRVLLGDRLHQVLVSAKRDKSKTALMFIDLDRFKPINDKYGHHIGDLLLVQVGHRMQSCIRESDTVARIGGDEFVVLLPNVETENDALRAAEKIRTALRLPFDIQALTLEISSSIGIALYPKHGQDWESLSKNADAAMYRAKATGRDAIVLAT